MDASKVRDVDGAGRRREFSEQDIAAFFDALRDRGSIEQMFDFLPDVSFYIKDRQCRWMACNATAVQSLNFRDRGEILGATEFDFFPRQIAEAIYNDDQRVMATGERLVKRIEVILDQSGHLAWVATNKVPLFDRKGTVIGLMGITRVDFDVERAAGRLSLVSGRHRPHSGASARRDPHGRFGGAEQSVDEPVSQAVPHRCSIFRRASSSCARACRRRRGVCR